MEPMAVNASAIPWQPAKDHAGLQRKILRVGSDGNPRVALLKLQPGFEMEIHVHGRAENHFVLEGMYESRGHEYPAGSYRLVPRHTSHGPFRSRSGAIVLVMWED